MTAFVSAPDVMSYLAIEGVTGKYDPNLIGSNIRAASSFLQRRTHRQFEPQNATTKKFTTNGDAEIAIPDLRTATSVTLQSAALTADAGYWLIPDRMNSGVYVAIQVRAFDTGSRGYLANPEWFDRNLDRDWARGRSSLPNDLTIVGNWGWDPYPDELLHATKVLAGFYTKRPQSLLAGSAITPDGNQLDYSDLPLEVAEFIKEWRLSGMVAAI